MRGSFRNQKEEIAAGLRVRIIVLSEGLYEGLLETVMWCVDSVRGLIRGSYGNQKRRWSC